ncbi:MAG: hypothetical protein QW688_03430 [Thermoprotei archaeon]
MLLGLVLGVTVVLAAAAWPGLAAQLNVVGATAGGVESGAVSGGSAHVAGKGANLTSGSIITLTSVVGGYRVVGETVNGSASAQLTLQVASVFHSGYTLSLMGGSIVIGGVTYTVASGTAQLGVHGNFFSGQGSLQSATVQPQSASNMVFAGKRVAAINGTPYYVVHLDVVVGQAEYLVTLIMQAQV